MGRNGLGIAKVVGNLDDLQRIQNLNAASLPPLTSKVTSVPPDPHLRHRQRVLRMAVQPRIDHPANLRPALPAPRRLSAPRPPIARHRRSSVAMPFSMIQAVNGRHRAAGVLHVGLQRLADEIAAGADHAAQGAALPVDMLGGGIDHDIGALLDRAAKRSAWQRRCRRSPAPPPHGRSSLTPRMSTSSSVGFDIDSKNTALVPGVTAARHWSRSAPSTKVTLTPKRCSTSSST